ncbi:uncharacterized protein LOC134258927 [Saccostrea cucullata]|uniref:uncharacterized protein LOC134258927 n=1 Tax=Saccostrea cuccullata TaxID=36930 RepID=UPI002ED4281A
MADVETKYPLGSPLQHVKICEEHDSIIDILCEECYAFICSICARLNHNGHNWVTQATAALQRRRGIHEYLHNVKEEKISKLDEEMQKMVSQMEENESMCDTQVKDLQRHYDDIILKLTDIKKNQEDVLKDNLRKTNEKMKNAKHNLEKIRKSIIDIMDFMAENNSTMSDFSLIDNHRQLEELLCEMNRYFHKCGNTAKYIRGEYTQDMLEFMIGHIVELDDICHAETNSFKYVEDGIAFLQKGSQTRLFTWPIRVLQNRNTDICVVNLTSDTTGEIVIVTSSGHLKTVYSGQDLIGRFCPFNIECDIHSNILVTDPTNHTVHLLSPDGEFLKYLLTEREVTCPSAMSLHKSTLWIGDFKGA